MWKIFVTCLYDHRDEEHDNHDKAVKRKERISHEIYAKAVKGFSKKKDCKHFLQDDKVKEF